MKSYLFLYVFALACAAITGGLVWGVSVVSMPTWAWVASCMALAPPMGFVAYFYVGSIVAMFVEFNKDEEE